MHPEIIPVSIPQLSHHQLMNYHFCLSNIINSDAKSYAHRKCYILNYYKKKVKKNK